MPIITDSSGTREVSEEELVRLRARWLEHMRAFFERIDALPWQPIAEYDRDTESDVVLDAGVKGEWVFGYWGLEPEWQEAQTVPAWRHRQDCMWGEPLDFEPTRFAIVPYEIAAQLAMD